MAAADIKTVTRIVIAGLAVCWLLVAATSWRGRRRDGARHMPMRWHRAVATLGGWSAERDGPPVAATWCRPLVQPVVTSRDLPQQRGGQVAATAAGELSGSPRS